MFLTRNIFFIKILSLSMFLMELHGSNRNSNLGELELAAAYGLRLRVGLSEDFMDSF